MPIINIRDLADAVIEVLSKQRARARYVARIRASTPPSERWSAIRNFYRLALPEMMAAPAHVWGIDPYEADWASLFTPIEFSLWQDIRSQGAVLYPQFPIGRFFVDFANPVARVVIECDGARWHTDKARDDAREREIRQMGWMVYRISGRDCLQPDEIEDEDGEYVPNPHEARDFIPMVARNHGLSTRYLDREDDDRC